MSNFIICQFTYTIMLKVKYLNIHVHLFNIYSLQIQTSVIKKLFQKKVGHQDHFAKFPASKFHTYINGTVIEAMEPKILFDIKAWILHFL